MKKYLIYIILPLLLSVSTGFGQISPGDLTNAHADLEGMTNCTLCHELGKKVLNSKCLDCHKEIKQLTNKKRGYHANLEVTRKDCFACHSEHHGRKFDMIRFDEDKFDHNKTGYKLEGQHGKIDCKKCHVPEYIKDREIKKRIGTFLGLDNKCLTCHDDFHQKTLSNDCAKCHDTETFRPAKKFDHDKADFKLRGEHIEVDCVKCHKKEKKNGKEFQIFTDIASADCSSCHDNPHNNRIKNKCAQCHTEKSFSTFIGKKKFKHNRRTDFSLKGKHKSVDCFSCHQKTRDPKRIFQDRKDINENQCAVCHEDAHDSKFGDDCAKCHEEKGFSSLKTMDFFDHGLTDFHLEGKHIGVDCKKCHKEKYTEPIDFSACKNCHEDYHQGDFKKNGNTPDCVECHSLSAGFDYSLFTLEQHQESPFPLEGAHIATPCFACHVSEERWTFRDIGSKCVDCHEDIHEQFISKKYYPENKCESCHVTDNWASVNFDHTLTDWPLEGRHKEENCSECHFSYSTTDDSVIQSFKELSNECTHCHENGHDNQFEINGITDCKRCHNSSGWSAENFDHNTTAFPLAGRHAEIECNQCHKSRMKHNKSIIEYKIQKFECIDCHQ